MPADPSQSQSPPPSGAPQSDGLAVDVVGYFDGVMGVGEHARQLVAALRTQPIAVATTTVSPTAAPQDRALLDSAAVPAPVGRADFNLVCVNADSIADVGRRLGSEFFAGAYTIGFWAWEVAQFPEAFGWAFDHVDEVWVGSRHVREAIEPLATVPVTVIPQPVSLPDDFDRGQSPPGLPAGFRFLFTFDYLSVFDRKNPLGTVAAFTRAFAPGSGAVLIVKTINADRDPDAHQRLCSACAAHPDIHLIDAQLSARERNGLVAAADCSVSLHRAEGFGYTMAEGMWAGKPVIATGYSGNLDYMTAENSYLVGHRLVPIGPGHDPYPASGSWAEPDIDHAALLMREVFADPEAARARGRRGAADIRASHGPQAAGQAMAARMAAVRGSRSWRLARHRRDPLDSDWVNDLTATAPTAPGARGGLGGVQRALRRAVLRVLRPVTVHQRLVDGDLLRAIEQLEARVRSLPEADAPATCRIEELGAALDQGQARSPSPTGSDSGPRSGSDAGRSVSGAGARASRRS